MESKISKYGNCPLCLGNGYVLWYPTSPGVHWTKDHYKVDVVFSRDNYRINCPLCAGKRVAPEYVRTAFFLMFPNYKEITQISQLPSEDDIQTLYNMMVEWDGRY